MSVAGDQLRAAFVAALQGRYGRSLLGRAWLVSPVVLVATLVVALRWLVGASQALSVLSLVLGIVLWNFFAGATSEGIGSIPARRALLQSGPDATWVLMSATVAVQLVELVLGLATFLACQWYLGPRAGGVAVQALAPLAMLVAFTLGVALAMVVLRARLGDADHLWKLVLAIGFWVTPVVYEIRMVPERLRPIVELNPMARIINEVRGAILHDVAPEPRHVAITIGACLAVLGAGRWLASRSAALIAERA